MKYYVGCSGWNQYRTWANDFYPNRLDQEGYIAYYSRIFDFVEVYLSSAASRLTLKNLAKQTPDNFRFTIRIPQAITEGNGTERLGQFIEKDVNPLEEKVLALVIQPSTRTNIKVGREWLDEVLRICACHGYQVVMQLVTIVGSRI